ncbi:MAG TPA: DUF1385 domain-containing protein [Candidatus Acidoferrales bacterium]|nr:DUF1385 domain-containing protein [Candidatus Acidoferrales bacterium]
MARPEGTPTASVAPPDAAPFFYGGQAVIEGVMMRGRAHYAIAVRLPRSGTIRIERGELTAPIYVSRVWRWPFLRGLAMLGEQLHLGMKSMMWSAAVNAGQEDVVFGRREIAISVGLALVASLVLFIGLPLLGAGLAAGHSGSVAFVIVEGLLRIGLVLGYLVLIAQLSDVKRVFQYHGAEHMTINAFEAGWPLKVENVRRASRLHPRCGTGFLVVLLVVSVVLFSLVALLHPNLVGIVLSRLVGIPIIASLSYEGIRFMARHPTQRLVRILLQPVLYTQKLTTRVPADDMIEVGIAAFQAARAGEGAS